MAQYGTVTVNYSGLTVSQLADIEPKLSALFNDPGTQTSIGERKVTVDFVSSIGVRGADRGARRSGSSGDGSDRCGMWSRHAEGVHWHDAPARRTTVPQGATNGSNQGGRLKLKVVRGIRGGHTDATRGFQAADWPS